MPDFVVKISTPADLSGAQATKIAIDAISAATGTAATGAAQAAEATGRFTDAAGRLREANGRFVEMGNSAQEAGKHIGEAAHEADHFLESLKAGMSIDIGHRIVEGIAEIPAAFREAIAEGVKFNQEMETLSINFGSAMRASDPGKFLSFAEARSAGVEALETIRQKANELGLDFAGVAHGFSINLAALREGGVKDTQQQIDLMIRLNQITAAKGITGMQSQRDIIDLLQGRGDRTIFGKELEPLGITNESIKQAREMGTLADLILTKTQAYGEAASASADTFTAAQQRLTNETQQLYGEIAKPVFEEVKEQVNLLTQELAKPEGREALKALGYDIATVVEAGGGLIRFAVENANVLVPLATGIGAVTLALAAYKTAQIASIVSAKLVSLVAETEATGAHAAAVAADTAAVEANTVARATGGGLGLNAATGGVVALGLLPGATIYASRQQAANEEGQRNQEVGEESMGHTDRAGKFLQDIKGAATDEERNKQRQALAEEQSAAQAKLAELTNKEQEMHKAVDEGDLAKGYSLIDPKRVEQIAALKEYVSELEHIQQRFSALAGTKPVTDTDAQKGEDALAKYKASPEYRLSQAEVSGDQGAIDDAKYDAQVDKKRAHLEKTYGLKPEVAEEQAQSEVTADDTKKQADDDAKEKSKADEKSKREADQASKKAAQEAANATAEAKQRTDAIASTQEEIAITQARANGEKDVADQLEKQRDIRLETTRLQSQGLSYAEAHALAETKINAQNANQDRVDAERAAKHQNKGSDTFTTFGYNDSDTGGGLHTETLDGHSRSVDRFSGVPDAAATALANAPTAADALANAPAYVSSFPTATSAFAPLAGALSAQAGGASGVGGDAGVTSAVQGVAQAADSTAQSAEQVAGSASQVASGMQALPAKFSAIDGHLSTLDAQLQTINGVLQNLKAGG